MKKALLILALLLAPNLTAQQVVVSGNTVISGNTTLGLQTGPAANVAPSTLSFGSIVDGVTSPGKTVTFTNVGNASMTLTSVTLSGANAADFAQTNTCGGTLAAGANCVVTVTFTPSLVGAESATLNFTDNAAGSPQTASLSGTGTAAASADCGLTSSTTKCGAVATVVPLTSPTNLSACNTALAAGNYILTQNIGASATTQCLGTNFPSGVVNIDLGGFTVTGYILYNTNHFDGTILQNGAISCNKGAGCVQVNGVPGAPSTGSHFYDLTITQTGTSGYGIFVSWQPSGAGSLEPAMHIDHIDCTNCVPGNQLNANRSNAIYMSGPYVGIEADHNLIILPSTASGCQGIVAYESPSSLVHNNYIQMQDPEGAVQDSCRGILFDSDGKFGVAGTGGGSSAYNNYIVSGANRAFRVRAENNDLFHDNTIVGANLGGRLGAIHIGEPTVSTDTASASVYNNAFTITGGNLLVCAGPGATCTVYSNTVTCTAGNCASAGYAGFTDALVAGKAGGNLNIKNTTLPGGYGNAVGVCGTAGTPTCTVNTDTSTATVCSTGTVVSGTGATVTTNSPPCP